MRFLLSCLIFAAAANAATISTTLTMTNASATLSGANIVLTGPVTLANIGSGTFSATGSLTNITGLNANAPFTITLSSGDKLTGTLTVPATLFVSATNSATASATVTGGTGAYAGATGSFPSLTGSSTGTVSSGLSVNLSGAGSITPGGGGSTAATPIITQVSDAASYSNTIAPGSMFVIIGSNLSPSGVTYLGFPLPTSASGVSVTFTASSGGAAINPYLVYLYNQNGVNQLAGILPSSAAPGSYNVTVTSGGATSAPTAISVAASHPRLFTQNSAGTGLAVVQNYISASEVDVNRFTTDTVNGSYISPAHPGQTLIAWVTGMGAAPGGDNNGSAGYDFTAHGVTVQAIVGGTKIPAAYAGRAPGLAGVDQVNFTLPANVPTGCGVSFQITAGNAATQPTFIAVAPDASSKTCVQPGWTSSQLSDFDHGGTYAAGSWTIFQFAESVPSVGNVKLDSAGGAFTVYSGFDLAGIPVSPANISTKGACTVIQVTGSNNLVTSSGGVSQDAGTVTLTGPNGSNINNAKFTQNPGNYYSLSIGEEGLPSGIAGLGNGTLVAGTYTLSGAGGSGVNAFSATATIGSPLTLTSALPSTVTESSGLTISWSPGSTSTDLVYIIGSSTTDSGIGGTANTTLTEFVCTTTAGALSFTVDPSILSQLPPTTTGGLEVYSTAAPSAGGGHFTATLKSGASVDSTFTIGVGYGAQVAYK